jgi:uncharacterized membrane protein
MQRNNFVSLELKFHNEGDDIVNEKENPILADRVTNVVGSGKFIFAQTLFLVSYVLFQSLYHNAFDPYPFILLNLLLSFQAAYTGPFVLWSQNRAADRDREVINSIRHMVENISHVLDSIQKVEKKMDKEVKQLIHKVDELEKQNREMLELLKALHEKNQK